MNQSAEAKLQELRCKTTRQLVSLISNKLDSGLAFARMLEGDGAEKALGDACAWMALLSGATQLEQRRLEFKIAQLRSALDEARVQVQAAC